jgi:iron(III) transport system substrate-binding protein
MSAALPIGSTFPPARPLSRPFRAALLATALASFACGRRSDLVVYCSLDQEFAEPLIRKYEAERGIELRVEFDIEASKTVGLVQRLREEAEHPRCDVFWSAEIGHTAQLGTDGLLEPYVSPNAVGIPPAYRDPAHGWTGFGARARVFIVNTDLCDPRQITTMWDLVDPKWAGKVAMAKPVTGTTLTHVAALYAVLGEERADEYVRRVAALAREGKLFLTNGNSIVARMVRDGRVAFGWTDSDDFHIAQEGGAHVAAVYPDAATVGTLVFPNSVAILSGCPHRDEARRFVDWVLRPETERELAFARSAQIPVRAAVPRPPDVLEPDGVRFKAMQVDFREIGRQIERRSEHLKRIFVE